MRRLIIVILFVLLVGAVWYFHGTGGDDSNAHGKNGAPVPVAVATASKGDIEVYLNELGNITPPNTIIVHSMINGILMKVLFNEGQLVKTDQLLAEIDSRPYVAQLEQAEGQLKRDEALLTEARLDLKRYRILMAQDSIAKQQLDQQVSLVKQYEGSLQNDKGLVDAAKTQIAYTKVTAPVGGRVGLRQVDPGNLVNTSDANGIVVVTQLQPITAVFTVPEDSIPEIMQHMQGKEQMVAEAWDRSGKTKLAVGKVYALDNQVDPTTGTVKVRAEFSNKDNALFPSQFVNIKCLTETKKNVVIVPLAAIQQGSDGSFVYLVKNDNTVTVQKVKVDVTQAEKAAIAEGIKEGDVVVTDGSDNLRESTSITIPAKEDSSYASQPGADGKKQHKYKKKDGDNKYAP